MEDLDQIVVGLMQRAISNGPSNLEAFRGTHLHWPRASLPDFPVPAGKAERVEYFAAQMD